MSSHSPPLNLPLNLHGTCVAFGADASDARAVLLRGHSGAGKSDLAYRLINEEGARLVADDRVDMADLDGVLVARAPAGWIGLLELRGLGLVTLPALEGAPLVLMVDLVERESVPRISEPCYEKLFGRTLPVLHLHAFDATTAAKIRLAVAHLPEKGFPGEEGRFG